MRKLSSILSWRQAKRLVVAVIGSTVVLLGLVMMLTPGPGLVVILAGLGILATEFVWARHLLKQVKERSQGAFAKARNGFRGPRDRHSASAALQAPPPEASSPTPPMSDPCKPPAGADNQQNTGTSPAAK